jgi:hypothetical protein
MKKGRKKIVAGKPRVAYSLSPLLSRRAAVAKKRAPIPTGPRRIKLRRKLHPV